MTAIEDPRSVKWKCPSCGVERESAQALSSHLNIIHGGPLLAAIEGAEKAEPIK